MQDDLERTALANKPIPDRKIPRTMVLLALPILLAAAVLAQWHFRNRILSGYDHHVHLTATLQYAVSLAFDSAQLPQMLSQQEARYTPLVYFAGGLLYLLTGVAVWMPVAPSLFWLAALTAALALGWNLSGGKGSLTLLPPLALLAVPTFWETGFSFNLETSLLAGVVIFFALLHAAVREKQKSSLPLLLLSLPLVALSPSPSPSILYSF